jgi:hypothetical protein
VEGAPGSEPGDHILEAEVSLDELAAILGEELELPRILPRGRRSVPVEKVKYSNIRRVGPESLRHFKRTFREALKRQVALGLYNPGNPLIVPIREDRRYRSWHVREVPESNAVIILCMDVSGSMGDQQKEIVRVASFWIDTWLRSQYKNLENVYVVHEAFAKEVDQHTFYHLRESGGTKISTAYELINAAIDSRFSPDSWNVYLFHFSDGENGDSRDTDQCMELLRKELLPKLNLFCFGQVRSSYGGGRFKNDIEDAFPGEGKVVTSEIRDKDEIYDAIKRFLGKILTHRDAAKVRRAWALARRPRPRLLSFQPSTWGRFGSGRARNRRLATRTTHRRPIAASPPDDATTTRLRPPSFAAYSARSAAWTQAETDSPSWRPASPALKVTRKAAPSRERCSIPAKSVRRRSTRRVASSAVRSSSTTANSSPP